MGICSRNDPWSFAVSHSPVQFIYWSSWNLSQHNAVMPNIAKPYMCLCLCHTCMLAFLQTTLLNAIDRCAFLLPPHVCARVRSFICVSVLVPHVVTFFAVPSECVEVKPKRIKPNVLTSNRLFLKDSIDNHLQYNKIFFHISV